MSGGPRNHGRGAAFACCVFEHTEAPFGGVRSVAGLPVPETVLMQVPQARPYPYAVVNNRVLLVDSATGTVVADVTQ